MILNRGGSPSLNLAMEEAILNLVNKQKYNAVVRIWINNPCVVIGYTLDPCEEVHCDVIDYLEIPLIRRISGGGAVYHDHGNINISIFMAKRMYVDEIYKYGTSLILNLLSRYNLNGYVENKSDIVVNNWKVSGSAAVIKSKASMFHATLLIRSNIHRLKSVIKTKPYKVLRGEVTSSKYSPANLSYFIGSIDINDVIIKLLNILENNFSNLEIMRKNPSDILEQSRRLFLNKYTDKYWSIKGLISYEEPSTIDL